MKKAVFAGLLFLSVAGLVGAQNRYRKGGSDSRHSWIQNPQVRLSHPHGVLGWVGLAGYSI